MSDAIKWGLLVAGALLVIGLIVALPFTNFIDLSALTNNINGLVYYAGDSFRAARGFINNFFTPFGRTVLSGLMFYLVGRWIITMTIKLTVWVYHFIFK